MELLNGMVRRLKMFSDACDACAIWWSLQGVLTHPKLDCYRLPDAWDQAEANPASVFGVTG
jgi:hypothetical protein